MSAAGRTSARRCCRPWRWRPRPAATRPTSSSWGRSRPRRPIRTCRRTCTSGSTGCRGRRSTARAPAARSADTRAADLITAFPGTSDYAWTRTLRAGSLGGYELQYFDAEHNRIENPGLEGVAEHPLREGIAGTLACYKRFDFLGDGETWMLDSYLDPAAALRATLDAMFDTIAGRARTKTQILAYLLNVDVIAHMGGMDQAVATLVEIDRRIREFKAEHRRPFLFTIFADHGNAHRRSKLVDPRQLLGEVGIRARRRVVARRERRRAAGAGPEAVPIVHTRVNYVALHAARADVAEIAVRSSRHADIDLAVARLPDGADGVGRYGIWRAGAASYFRRDATSGRIVVEDPEAWSWLGVDLTRWCRHGGRAATLDDREAFEATAAGPYPDIFYRVATAFSHPASRFRADVLLSMPDDVASYGFNVPGAADIRAADGFHGSLSRASTLSVVASEAFGCRPPSARTTSPTCSPP